MVKCKNWLLLNHYPKEKEKYEQYTTTVTREKVEVAVSTLKEKDIQILRLIQKMKIITSIQLARIIFKEGNEVRKFALQYTTARLKKLYELGCIDRFFPISENSKSKDYVHVVMGPVGARVLKIEKFRRIKSLPSHWRHAVMVNDIFSNLYVKFKIVSWLKEIKLEWKNEATVIHNLQPDALIGYTNNKHEKYAFIEADMGTETISTLLGKIKRYIEYYNTMEFKRAFWQPHRKNNITILPEVWFIMKYKKDATSLKTKLGKLNSNVIFKVVWIEDIKVSI